MRVAFATQWFPPERGAVAESIATGLATLGCDFGALPNISNYPAGIRAEPRHEIRDVRNENTPRSFAAYLRATADPCPGDAAHDDETRCERFGRVAIAMSRHVVPNGPLLYGVTIADSASAFLSDQLNLMAARHPDVHLVYGNDGRAPVGTLDARVTQTELSIRREPALLGDFKGLVALIAHLRRLRPRTVVMGTPKMALLGLFAAWLCRVPRRVHVLHGLRLEGATGVRRAVLWGTERLSTACATEVLAVSRSVRDESLRLRLTRPGKIDVIGEGSICGVDLSRFHVPAPEQRALARARFGLPKDELVLGFVGRLTPDKGLAEMTAVWAQVHTEHPNAWFLVVGTDEATGRGLGHLVTALAALPRVRFVGSVPDPELAFMAMDVLLLLTRREGFPLVLLEAAACGVPAVVTKVRGTVDAVVEGETATLVPWGDVAAAAAAVGAYLTNPQRRREHGVAGRNRAIRDFAANRVAEAWADRIHPVTPSIRQEES